MTKQILMLLENLQVGLMVFLLAISMTGYLGWHPVSVPIVEGLFVTSIARLGIKNLKKKVVEGNHV